MQNDEYREDDSQTEVEVADTETTEDANTTDWEAEAKKWKAIAERKARKAEQAQQVQTPSDTNLSNKEVERLTLKVDGYNDEEIGKIMELGGLKALQNPLVKNAVDVMREERRAENAQVTAEGATSDFTRKYSSADLRKMSASELEKILPQ